MSRLARKKKEAEDAKKVDDAPSWVGRDHKVKLSYLKNIADGNGLIYPCLCKRFVTDPTFRVFAGEEKRAGKLVQFKRNVFVAPYELVEICIGFKSQLWYGRLTYDKHNIIRRKATKDDTWPLKDWLDKVINAVQNSADHPNIDFVMNEQPNKAGTAMDFLFEIKERINGRTINYINPALLTRVTNDLLGKLSAKDKLREFGRMTVLPSSPIKFFDHVMAINLDSFIRLVKSGKVEKAKDLVALGYLNVHAFEGVGDLPRYDDEDFDAHPPGQGWNALQHAAYFGRRPMVLYLLDELKLDMKSRSADGWTAMHCACKMGHFEIAKELYERGMDLFDETKDGGGGFTPLSLMLENRHMGMVKFFIGEDSKFAKTCYKNHGVRPTHLPEDMYWYLKPLPEELMIEIRAAQREKAAKLKAQKRAEWLAENPEAAVKEKVKASKGGNKRASSKESTESRAGSASRSPSRTGTVQSKKKK